MAVWSCGSKNCATHRLAGDLCAGGIWLCGRVLPACPGHSGKSQQCAAGTGWSCGAKSCPTHGNPRDKCPSGVWRCGKLQPLCIGHRTPGVRCLSEYQNYLLPGERADFPGTKPVPYGEVLRANKALLNQVFDNFGIGDERRALIIAMAMIETTQFLPVQRDTKKDNQTDGSANASIFNLSEDMLRRLGHKGNIHALDPLGSLPAVVRLLNRAFDNWGVRRTLNFVRGGGKAFDDGYSHDAGGYRNAVATILKFIDSDPSFLTDVRRVEANVKYQ
jgi:hypothetical protein